MCKVMGIVNVTPDSFSDGGQFFRPEEAIRRARNLVAEGADIIDFGGESTRPGATPISWDEEWARLEPVLRGFAASGSTCTISVDTYHPETAERALAVGATMINCVYSEPAREMLRFLAKPVVELVVPATTELDSARGRAELRCQALRTQHQALSTRHSAPGTLHQALCTRLWLDPMIGFGTTREEDLERLRSIATLAKRGRVLVGASRKRIVKKLTGVEGAVGKSIGGNVALAVWAALQGASAVRVHDVRETVQALRVIDSLSRHCLSFASSIHLKSPDRRQD